MSGEPSDARRTSSDRRSDGSERTEGSRTTCDEADAEDSDSTDVTAAELMTAAIARRLDERDVRTAFQGFSSPLPTVAVRLARALGADVHHLSASGAVDGRPARLPRSTEDQRLLAGASAHFTSPEAFDMAARGDLEVMFVGGAQFDRRGRMNSSAVGSLAEPDVRFPGGGGSGSLLPLVREAWGWRTEHSPRTLPASVDVVTASGNLTYLLTPLCALEPVGGELRATALAPGVDEATVRARTGWDVGFGGSDGKPPGRLAPPTDAELAALDRVDPDRVRRTGFAPDQLTPLRGEPK